MEKNHPLQYFLKKRKIREADVDEFIKLICATSWMRGNLNTSAMFDEIHEAWSKIKQSINFKVK